MVESKSMNADGLSEAEETFVALVGQRGPKESQSTEEYLHDLQVASAAVVDEHEKASQDEKVLEIAEMRAALRASNYKKGLVGANPVTTKAAIDAERAKATAANLAVRAKRRALIGMGATALLGGIAVATGGGGLAAAQPIVMPIIDKLITGLFERPA